MAVAVVCMGKELKNIRLIQKISRIHVILYNILGCRHPGASVEAGPCTAVPVKCAIRDGFPGRHAVCVNQVASHLTLLFNSRVPVQAAYVQESFYIGAENLEALVNIKSKNELIGDVIMLLQSPAKNVISALQSSGQTIHGLLKTLEER